MCDNESILSTPETYAKKTIQITTVRRLNCCEAVNAAIADINTFVLTGSGSPVQLIGSPFFDTYNKLATDIVNQAAVALKKVRCSCPSCCAEAANAIARATIHALFLLNTLFVATFAVGLLTADPAFIRAIQTQFTNALNYILTILRESKCEVEKRKEEEINVDLSPLNPQTGANPATTVSNAPTLNCCEAVLRAYGLFLFQLPTPFQTPLFRAFSPIPFILKTFAQLDLDVQKALRQLLCSNRNCCQFAAQSIATIAVAFANLTVNTALRFAQIFPFPLNDYITGIKAALVQLEANIQFILKNVNQKCN